jgi:hypothetical protein
MRPHNDLVAPVHTPESRGICVQLPGLFIFVLAYRVGGGAGGRGCLVQTAVSSCNIKTDVPSPPPPPLFKAILPSFNP